MLLFIFNEAMAFSKRSKVFFTTKKNHDIEHARAEGAARQGKTRRMNDLSKGNTHFIRNFMVGLFRRRKVKDRKSGQLVVAFPKKGCVSRFEMLFRRPFLRSRRGP